MSTDFNVPPVVFPSGGNPNTGANVASPRRLFSHRDLQTLASPNSFTGLSMAELCLCVEPSRPQRVRRLPFVRRNPNFELFWAQMEY
ncbi:hypothetical protein L1987_02726 [Smallanthus sonchifolius]|uniref:Uncharacterized protein n=1 Tax=Smallanthus sonchifolius TaxID=185202 RepID=A0ACB9K8L4_9ASTR|nr:hypothetical protein L1987_02726 [Smallanthus sonchifolius]